MTAQQIADVLGQPVSVIEGAIELGREYRRCAAISAQLSVDIQMMRRIYATVFSIVADNDLTKDALVLLANAAVTGAMLGAEMVASELVVGRN